MASSDGKTLLGFTLSSHRYRHIDALRAFAVMLVVIAHTDVGGIPGGSGVTIFFTISGFVITNLLLRERQQTGGFAIGEFYSRRLLKIAPPFLIAIVLPTLIYSVWSRVSWDAFLLQIFFLFNWVSQLGARPIDVLPGSSVVWSLSIEEQFYITFALYWLLASRLRRYIEAVTATAILLVVASASVRVVYATAGWSENRISSGTDTRVEGIAIGILVAVIVNRSSSPRPSRLLQLCQRDAALIAAVGMYLISLAIRDESFRLTLRYSMQSIATAVVILYGFQTDRRSRMRTAFSRVAEARAVQLIGLASYSIYITHAQVMRLARANVESLAGFKGAVPLVVLGVVSGVVLWRLVEVPIVTWRRRLKAEALTPW